jgi:acetate kinase
MAITLVVNPGSASKKYALYEENAPLFSMRFERTESGFEQCTERNGVRQKCAGVSAEVFKRPLPHFLKAALEELIIKDYSALKRVVVRVVAPGGAFQKHARVDDLFLHKLHASEFSAPLHVPHTVREIEAVRQLLPSAVIIAASDSAFHATLPPRARRYSIAPAEAAALDLYRFGYHGLSVASVVRRFHSVALERPGKLIVCHVGGGVSVSAVKNKVSVETSMGYAPGGGLIMGSRAGDLDVEALLSLMRARNLRPLDAKMYIETRGGLHGLLGESDLRLIIERRARGDKAAADALAMFTYAIGREIAAATVALGGCENLVFTGTAVERSPILRALICAEVAHLGLSLDETKNDVLIGRDGVASAHDSRVKIVVIRTDEMGEMALIASSVHREEKNPK